MTQLVSGNLQLDRELENAEEIAAPRTHRRGTHEHPYPALPQRGRERKVRRRALAGRQGEDRVRAALPRVHEARPAGSSPGEIYLDGIDVPTPGCWQFDLSWATSH